MANSFNRLDPMNKSIYLEAFLPSSTIDETLNHSPYLTNFPAGAAGPLNPNSPKLAPQPAKDSFYYRNDGTDDGKISGFEKFKAFIKGGTYNIVKGMFCDENGFSIKRTLLTAGAIGAIALTGPIGAAVAGGIGLVTAGAKLVQSAKLANRAVTDQQAREAYEGAGEGTTIAALSLWGGFKGLQALKNNFSSTTATLTQKLTKWKLPEEPVIPEEPVTPEPEPATFVEESAVESNNLPVPVNRKTELPPIEEFLLREKQTIQLPDKTQRALPSPEMVRARMEADGQINLPAETSKLELPPIEEFLPKEQQLQLSRSAQQKALPSPEMVRARMEADVQINPLSEAAHEPARVRISPAPKRVVTPQKKLEIFEGSRDLVRRTLGNKTAEDYMPAFERAATRTRVKMLPEIFQYIREYRANARAVAKAENGGVLPKGYKDPIEYGDALDLYRVIQNNNSGYVRSLMKGRYSIKDIINAVKQSEKHMRNMKKNGSSRTNNTDVRTVSNPTSSTNSTYTSGMEPIGKVPPETPKTVVSPKTPKTEVFPEHYPAAEKYPNGIPTGM